MRGHAGDKGKKCSAGTGVRDEARRWSGRRVKAGEGEIMSLMVQSSLCMKCTKDSSVYYTGGSRDP